MRSPGIRLSRRRRPWYKTLVFLAVAQVVIAIPLAWLAIEIGMALWSARLRTEANARFTRPPVGRINFADANFRIVATGDSHTFGIGAPPGKSYPEHLARLIHQERPDLRTSVINVGRPGYNSSQALNALKDYFLARWPTDLVLVGGGGNNEQNLSDATILDGDIARAPDRAKLAHLLSHSRAYKLSWIARTRIRQLLRDGVEDITTLDCVLCGGDQGILADWLKDDLRAMVNLAREQGARPVIVGYWHRSLYVHRAMTSVSRDMGVPFVRNYDFNLPSRGDVEHFLAPDLHPNSEGYMRMASAVYLSLVDENLLPPAP
ncbi:hypothetical protein K8I61_10615 [bacterium]|nr:hypothetical protein [bacterium]